MSLAGGVTFGPKEGRTILFGRNRPEVHVCLGESDLRVSRHQGTLSYADGKWWVGNTGRAPIRVASSRLLIKEEQPVPLDIGYTPLFVRGGRNREHLLEIFVTGSDGQLPVPQYAQLTKPPDVWQLSPDEKLALVALGQRYLLYETRPQPWTWDAAAALLAEVVPDASWKPRRVEHLVNGVRARLSRAGVPGLTRDEVGEPVGNSLNDNLLRELLLSTTLVSRDLELLDHHPVGDAD
ncbi:hypothetical protein [Nocardia colli]|uniref:hypothetical protein n=1 Tax=Nocardia colli TaxID=2545717 RepID=UPI001CC6AC49|nr:hypothetical protein [Nocardia colli]